MLLNLGSCNKCHGDLVHEGDEWRCLQCGKYYYPERQQPLEPVGARKAWRLNTSIRAIQASDTRWQSSNREIIDQLSAGHTTREIADLTNQSPRRVRSVRDRLDQIQAQ